MDMSRSSHIGRRRLSAIVAENVRAEAARRRLTSRQLGRIVGLSQPATSDRARGRTSWTVDEIAALAEAFGMPPAALLEDQVPNRAAATA